ncbi:MAG: hypothetical protein GX100_10970 [candidate division WS1 bacterium]|nr:hypothetical protein [candidate division WS1 bacterium]
MSDRVTSWLTPREGDRLLHVSPDGPLTSLAAARDALRALPAAEREAQPLRVLVHNGDYVLPEPFVLLPEDSGTPQAPIVYQAAPGEAPRFSGGRLLQGWTVTEHNGQPAWTLEIPEVKSGAWWFTQLFVEGERRPRSRLPQEGYFRLRGATADKRVSGYQPGDLRPFHNLSDVAVTVLHFWVDSHLAIAELDEATHTVTFDRDTGFSGLMDENRAGDTRYFLENVLEGLVSPGQWYLDRSAGLLTYLPLPGEDPATTRVIAPVLEQLVLFQGQPDCPVHDVHLAGLRLHHTEWNYAPDCGGSSQAAWRVPGALALTYAADCSLRCNEISHLANYAVEAGEGCRGITVLANRLHDLGAGGVKLGSAHAPGSQMDAADSGFHFVSDNSITEGGRRYQSAIGVWIGHSGDNVVTHNHIYDFFYTGISVGWIWGFMPSKARRNLIAHNHIHTIGQGVLSDMGAIYSLGVSPGTRICHNLLHDVHCYSYGGTGLYPDEGTSFVLYEDNVVYNTDSGGLHMNYGRDDLFRNNIFALARDVQIGWGTPKFFRPYRCEGNLVYWRTGAAISGCAYAGLRQVDFDRNLYWQAEGRPGDFAGGTWEDWQARGLDVNGVIADPLFTDPEHGDFSLRADSPALALGFRPIDMTTIGPRTEVLLTGEAPAPDREIGAFVWPRLLPASDLDPAEVRDQIYYDYPDTTPCAFTVRAIFENAGTASFRGPVTLRAYPEASLDGASSATCEISLEPGEEIELTLDLQVKEGTEEILAEVQSGVEGFWDTSVGFAFRPALTVPRLPEGVTLEEVPTALAQASPIPVTILGGHLLGTYRVGVTGDYLALFAEVNDSAFELVNPVYKGSMIDLFAKRPGFERRPGQVFLVPGLGDVAPRMVSTDMAPVEGGEARCTATPTGYQMAALIPLSALEIEIVDGEFAFTAAIYTHVPGLAGVQRGRAFHQRPLNDVHAYPRLILEG